MSTLPLVVSSGAARGNHVVYPGWLELSVSKHNRSRDRRMIGLDAVAVHSDVTLDMSDSLMFAFEATAE